MKPKDGPDYEFEITFSGGETVTETMKLYVGMEPSPEVFGSAWAQQQFRGVIKAVWLDVDPHVTVFDVGSNLEFAEVRRCRE